MAGTFDTVTSWPPPYEGMVNAPAGEPASSGWALPTQGTLDYAHKSLQVLFLMLALVGLFYVLHEGGFARAARGAARKHVVG